jgi:aminoglycoside phosphotransferase (APT) family kinase protein
VTKEHTWLPRLAPMLPFPVPRILGLGTPAAGYPWHWAVLRWIDGDLPVAGALADAQALATDLGSFVAALRGVDLPGGPVAYRGVPLAAVDAGTRPARWLHSDLMPMNLLVRGGRLAAVLDFGTLGTGDPACDLIPAWNLLPAGARSLFRDASGADDADWARGRGWALSMALNQLPYYRFTNPVIAGNAEHVIREVLAEGPAP